MILLGSLVLLIRSQGYARAGARQSSRALVLQGRGLPRPRAAQVSPLLSACEHRPVPARPYIPHRGHPMLHALLRLPLAVISISWQSVVLALGQLHANKARALLTTLGIAVGVASITAIMSILIGFRDN